MTKHYEIVELPNGDVALQREGENDAQTLVTIRFSTELVRFLEGDKFSIAKVMMEAGLERVAEVANQYAAMVERGEEITDPSPENKAQPETFTEEKSVSKQSKTRVRKSTVKEKRISFEGAESEEVDEMNTLAMESHLVH